LFTFCSRFVPAGAGVPVLFPFCSRFVLGAWNKGGTNREQKVNSGTKREQKVNKENIRLRDFFLDRDTRISVV
jgi:hypothetical protein